MRSSSCRRRRSIGASLAECHRIGMVSRAASVTMRTSPLHRSEARRANRRLGSREMALADEPCVWCRLVRFLNRLRYAPPEGLSAKPPWRTRGPDDLPARGSSLLVGRVRPSTAPKCGEPAKQAASEEARSQWT